MKYQLMVSHDCGMNYFTEAVADDVMAFADRCKELDDGLLRWTIADENGEDVIKPEFVCRIFRGIFDTIGMLQVQENAKAMKPFYERDALNEPL